MTWDVFSISTEKSVKAILEELDRFRLQSGFTISYEKTTLYRIGSLRHSDAQLYSIDQLNWSNKDINVLGVTITHDNILEKNYSTVVNKAKQTLSKWYNGGLSLIGKIQVVNTLIASLFVYKMTVFPYMPENIIKNINNIIRDYIWNGKKSKIAYNILQLPKAHGGLNLVNLRNKDIAIKATWPQILYHESEYALLVYKLLRVSALGHDIWRCSLKPEDVKSMKFFNQFWVDVLCSWSSFNTYYEVRIENQLIWYNSSIRIRDKPIMWSDVYRKRLKFVYQLLQDGMYKTDQLVFEEYGLTKMRFNSLKAAIPTDWKLFFQSTTLSAFLPLPSHNVDKCIHVFGRGFSQEVYKFLAEDVMSIHNKYMGWRKDLGEDWSNGLWDFGGKHRDIYSITNVPKYRSFQYRLLQRGIVTNIQLSKWGILESNLCYYCNEEKEELVHLFCTCPIILSFWHKIRGCIDQEYGTQEWDLGPTAIIFNKIVRKKNHAVNFICLVTKQYIYQQRCLKGSLNISRWRNHIKRIENIEKYIAIKNGKIYGHQKKWTNTSGNNAGMNPDLDNQWDLMQYIDNM